MKSYTQYLQESKKTWKFKIKTIHELTDDQSDRIEKHLLKYDSNGLGAARKTMLQSATKEFPSHRGYEVYTYEFETKLSATSAQIYNEIRTMLGLSNSTFKIKGDHEQDLDEEATVVEPKAVDGKDLYGDDYNSGFIKELLKLRKEKEKGNE